MKRVYIYKEIVPKLQNFLSQIVISISIYTCKVANSFQELKVLTRIWQKENSPLVQPKLYVCLSSQRTSSSHDAVAPRGPGHPNYRGFTITLTWTQHVR